MKKLEPLVMRDFTPGVNGTLNNALTPDNVLRKSINGFSDISQNNKIGNWKTRLGYYYLGNYDTKTAQFSDSDAGNLTPDFTKNKIVGLHSFNYYNSNSSGILAAVSDNTSYNQTVVFYFVASTWTPITATNTFDHSLNIRFANLGPWVFGVQYRAIQSMYSFNPASSFVWGTTNTPVGLTYKNLIVAFQGKLYTASDQSGVSGNTKVFYSKLPDTSGDITWDTTNDWIKFGQDNAQYSGFAVNNFLLVFKRYGMYTFDGVSTQSEPLYQVGAINQEVIKTIKGVTYFAGPTEKGISVFAYRGSEPEEISDPVKDWLAGYVIPTTPSYDDQFEIAASVDEDNYYLHLGDVAYTDGVTYNNVVLRYNIKLKNWHVFSLADQVLTSVNFQPHELSAGNIITKSYTYKGKLNIIGDDTGTVSIFGYGNTDNGTLISANLQTKELEFGSRSRKKQINKFNAFASGNYGSVDVQMRIDGGNWVSLGKLTGKTTTFSPGKQGYYFEFRLIGGTKTLTTLNDPTLGDEPFVFEGFEFFNVTIEDYPT